MIFAFLALGLPASAWGADKGAVRLTWRGEEDLRAALPGGYVASLGPQRDVDGRIWAVELMLSRAGQARNDLLFPKGHWHGVQPFDFAAWDLAGGLDYSVHGRVRRMTIRSSREQLVVSFPAPPVIVDGSVRELTLQLRLARPR